MLNPILRPFIAGLVAALPLTLTIVAVVWLADLVHKFLGPESAFGKVLGSFGLRFVTSEVVAYLLGLGVALGAIYLLGLAVELGMKNRWNRFVDFVMNRLPVVKSVYHALKKLMSMFEQKEQSDVKAMSPVLCRLGGKEGTAVLALMPSPEPVYFDDQEYYAVMIPTAPVPFGGAILYVPAAWVEPASLTFDGLFNIYMSMGATSHEYFGVRKENVSGPQPGASSAEPVRS